MRSTTSCGELPTSTMVEIAFLLVRDSGLRRAPLPSAQPPLVLEIAAEDRLLVDQESITVNALLDVLRPILYRCPGRRVVLRPTAGADYHTIVRVFDLLRQARTKLGLAAPVNVSLPTEDELLELWR